MKKRNVILSVILMSVIGLLIVMALNVQPQVSSVNTVTTSFKPITGAYVAVLRVDGDYEDYGWNSNLFTNAGKEYLEANLANQLNYGNFTWIGLCNLTAGCAAGATDTTIDAQYTNSGLAAQAGLYTSQAGSGNWSIYTEFTSTAVGMSVLTNMTGLMNQSASGTLLAVVQFTDVTLATGDKLLINWTCSAT